MTKVFVVAMIGRGRSVEYLVCSSVDIALKIRDEFINSDKKNKCLIISETDFVEDYQYPLLSLNK